MPHRDTIASTNITQDTIQFGFHANEDITAALSLHHKGGPWTYIHVTTMYIRWTWDIITHVFPPIIRQQHFAYMSNIDMGYLSLTRF